MKNPDAVWYRGHTSTDYSLIPSLLRHDKGPEVERGLFDEYEKFAENVHGRKDDDWLLLMDMQHYGIPTRLLDWTTVLGIAVSFAVLDGKDDEHSVIYMLDPIALNAESHINEIVRIPARERKFAYKDIYWKGDPFKPSNPIAVDAVFHNPRISAQNGTFTVHGTEQFGFKVPNTNGFDFGMRYKPHVDRVLLPASAKEEAREFLEHANINAYTIYPDSVGIAHHLRRKFFG
ncbi:FRG domain-containing protein [Celeribacter sp. SCSIO 80788]|uniref:FRG domain-containing protein n=1 Tax=Celeribacter sp. SCSIO 80788 TaxID=3117013 RepID=UPI003DA45054